MDGIKRFRKVNDDFVLLVNQLDKYLVTVDGDDNAFYDQYNKIDKMKHIVLFYKNDMAVACGGMKPYDNKTMEIKRMWTNETERKKGIASKILSELEEWARELLYEKCILETGARQLEALKFYERNGYNRIPNFGQYSAIENSRCFEKVLNRG